VSDPQDDRIVELEHRLDGLERGERQAAFDGLLTLWRSGGVAMPPERQAINVHLHTFHSYNAYGYSPTRVAWLARQHGLAVAGIVDFDVLAGMDEFLAAARALDLRATVGMETRVFIPEFADCVITSPGEPGISYHMGIGFATSELPDDLERYRRNLQTVSQDRNRRLVERVNAYLQPVVLDYQRDLADQTPSGNVTERHICDAYVRKAAETFKAKEEVLQFWAAKLSVPAEAPELGQENALRSLVRSRTMKKGGVGYIEPDTGSFPKMEEFNRFAAGAGAMPALTWVDGISEGEKRMEELCRLAMRSGVTAINAIPDPRYTPHKGAEREKVRNLHDLVALARRLGLLIISGTEMNIHGQKFADDFGDPDLRPVGDYLIFSAQVFYGHTVLQRQAGLGYLSDWTTQHLAALDRRNEFYALIGRTIRPSCEARLGPLTERVTPEEVIAAARG